jgi:hypothetical protein
MPYTTEQLIATQEPPVNILPYFPMWRHSEVDSMTVTRVDAFAISSTKLQLGDFTQEEWKLQGDSKL